MYPCRKLNAASFQHSVFKFSLFLSQYSKRVTSYQYFQEETKNSKSESLINYKETSVDTESKHLNPGPSYLVSSQQPTPHTAHLSHRNNIVQKYWS